MTKKMISSMVLICASLMPSSIYALTITDVMFDAEGSDVGHEWVAIFNDGETPLSLTQWRVVVDGKRHKIRVGAGGSSLPPATSAVIADDMSTYLSDHPDYTGIIYESALSLPNRGARILLVDEKETVAAEKTYEAVPKQKKTSPSKKVQKKDRSQSKELEDVRASHATENEENKEEDQSNQETSRPVAQTAAAASGLFAPNAWLIGAGMLGLIGIGAAVASRKKQKDEWHIADLSDDEV